MTLTVVLAVLAVGRWFWHGMVRKPDHWDRLLADIRAWQAATFTQRTPESISEHLRREAHELAARPHDMEEAADVFLLLVGLTDGRDLEAAVRYKLDKNKARKWGQPDAHGVVEHIS